ncbi:hypothetical protein TgHK011_003113 [Trichoderma gracile]|nr:hypothetical protein TgHK011_003113 [Trichoderma gracile]
MAGFLPSQADCDPVQNILEWQSQQLQVQPSDYVEEAADHNAIAGLTASLLSLFKAIVPALAREQQTKIPQTARISLERSCSALILWSSGYGIAEGRLNDAFNRSRKLRYTTLKNLLHIGRVLVERLLPLVNVSEKLQALCSSVESNIEEAAGIIAEASSRQSDASSSDAASDFSNDDIHEIAEDLKTDTLVLSNLDSLLKYPIFDTQHEDAADGVVISTWTPEKLFSDRIEHRFPSAATPLASRLGRANYERFLRCQATRDAQEIAEALFVTNREEQAGTGTIIADSKFHDSGVGTSLGTSIVLTAPYAETTMSYNHDGQSVRIPPLSKEAKSGLPFSCIACGHNIIVTNNSGWKRHIYLDLQPYMCLDMSCPYSSTAFESRERWVAHLALDHEMEPRWESTQCALCKEQTGSGKMAFLQESGNLDRPSNDILRLAAAQGDEETVARILQVHEGFDDPEATVAAARQGHDLVLQLLLGLGGASLDPAPVETLPADMATPMLAAIGQKNIKVIELILEQAHFNPTRTFKGETYYEIARRRQGPNWEQEENILRKAYNEYRRTHDAHVNEDLQRKDLGTNASFKPEAPSFTENPTSQSELETHQTIQRPYTCSICHMSFHKEADCDRHTKVLHIEKAKDYHDFLATVKSYFKDQPDKFTRFLNILTMPVQPRLLYCHSYSAAETVHQAHRCISNVDTNDVAKSHIGHVELHKVEFTESWVAKVKDRYIGSPHIYRQLLEILRDTQDNTCSTQDAYLAANKLFGVNRDLIDEFQILTAKGELKLEEPLLQRIRSVAQYGTGSPEQLRPNRVERDQGSMEAVGEASKGNASDSHQLLCCICHEAGSGNMIQCDNTDSCRGKWFHLLCVDLFTAPAATAKWQCPECRERVDTAEAEEAKSGGSGKQKHIPSFGRINYPQPNPDIYIWPPDSYGSVDELPEEASSSYVPQPLPPPSPTQNDNTVHDEDDSPAPTEMPTFGKPPRVPESSFVPPVPSRQREVTTMSNCITRRHKGCSLYAQTGVG